MSRSPQPKPGWFDSMPANGKYFLWGILTLVVIAGVIWVMS